MTQTELSRPRKERKENADKRRRQLLDATLRSIVVNGLTKTTLATVAEEAGLSQGVAVFYFKSKGGLLTEALRMHYERYERNWSESLEAAGDDPLNQLIALIRADFSPEVCNPDALAVWYAFWGEQKFSPQYAEISLSFDQRRSEAIGSVCEKLLTDAPAGSAADIAEWIDTFTDGYWHKLHIYPADLDRDHAVSQTLKFVGRMIPEVAEWLDDA